MIFSSDLGSASHTTGSEDLGHTFFENSIAVADPDTGLGMSESGQGHAMTP